MKKVVLMILAIALCLLVFSGCNRKSNENDPLPPLSALSEYSEEQLNEILSDYTMYDIHAAWGAPERDDMLQTLHCDFYSIQDSDKRLVISISYGDGMKVKSVSCQSLTMN